LMVMVSVDVPPTAIDIGENIFVTLGGAKTLSVALAVPPAPVSVALTLPVVFGLAPAVVALTTTLIAHVLLPPVPSEPPDRLMAVAPADGLNVPPQVVVAPGVALTSTPAGSESLIDRPVSASEGFGLVKLMVNVEVLPTAMLVGEKLLETVGGAATISVAVLETTPVPPLAEVGVTLLVCVPSVLLVILTVITHGLAVVTVALLTLTEVEPAVKPVVV
jgi:hypothetical protein